MFVKNALVIFIVALCATANPMEKRWSTSTTSSTTSCSTTQPPPTASHPPCNNSTTTVISFTTYSTTITTTVPTTVQKTDTTTVVTTTTATATTTCTSTATAQQIGQQCGNDFQPKCCNSFTTQLVNGVPVNIGSGCTSIDVLSVLPISQQCNQKVACCSTNQSGFINVNVCPIQIL